MIRLAFALAMSAMLGCGAGPTGSGVVSPDPSSPGGGPVVSPPSSNPIVVTVDAGKQHQRIQGFGSSTRIFSDPHLIGQQSALQLLIPDENAVLDSVYRTIGLTRARVTFQSNGTEAAPGEPQRRDWVFADGHIDLVKRAKAKGLQEWWLSPIKLEPWMNASTVSQYVDWSMGIIRYWRTQGVELTWYSIANEPNPMGVSGDFLRETVKLLGKKLAAEGFQTKLVIPDDINPQVAAEKTRIVLSDPEARKYVGALASHLYDLPLSAMSEMTALSSQYGLPLWMSEYSVPGKSPLDWGELVHRLLTEYNVSAVDYMWGFFGDRDQAQLVAIHDESRRFTGASITPAGYGMAQYARFVLPGATRVESVSSDSTVLATAFVRNGKLTIVALNKGIIPRSVRFAVKNADGLTDLRLVRTSDQQHLAEIGRVTVTGGVFDLELPGRTISTFIQ